MHVLKLERFTIEKLNTFSYISSVVSDVKMRLEALTLKNFPLHTRFLKEHFAKDKYGRVKDLTFHFYGNLVIFFTGFQFFLKSRASSINCSV